MNARSGRGAVALLFGVLALGARADQAASEPPPRSSNSVTARSAPIGTAKLPEPGRQVLFADLDGDGRDDPVIVYGGKSGCHLGRLVRRDNAIAVEPLAAGEGAPLFAPELGDLDGDGTKDLLSADADGILMRKGAGNGVFAPLARRIVQATDLLLTTDACEAIGPYLHESTAGRPDPSDATAGRPDPTPASPGRKESDDAAAGGPDPAHAAIRRAPELVLPVLGGARLVRAGQGAGSADPPQDLLSEPRIIGREDGLLFVSAAPVWIGTGASEIATVGPLLGVAAPRPDLSWWSREQDGSLQGHRTSLALPSGENAALAYAFDLEGDGRPEIALLTTPARLKSFFGEYALRIYHATDRADVPAEPFYSGKTDINFWQLPALSFHAAPGGGELLIAFYRGLLTAHLNIEVFSSDGKGSFEKGFRDVELASEKKAERGFLIWRDVNADGKPDLVTADGEGLRIHAGMTDRARPVSSEPSWTASIVPKITGTSISVSGDGAWSIAFGQEGSPIFRDLDGDGLSEAIVVDSLPAGGGSVTVGSLKARGK